MLDSGVVDIKVQEIEKVEKIENGINDTFFKLADVPGGGEKGMNYRFKAGIDHMNYFSKDVSDKIARVINSVYKNALEYKLDQKNREKVKNLIFNDIKLPNHLPFN